MQFFKGLKLLSISGPQRSMRAKRGNLFNIVNFYECTLVNRNIAPGNFHYRQNRVNGPIKRPRSFVKAFCMKINISFVKRIKISIEVNLKVDEKKCYSPNWSQDFGIFKFLNNSKLKNPDQNATVIKELVLTLALSHFSFDTPIIFSPLLSNCSKVVALM